MQKSLSFVSTLSKNTTDIFTQQDLEAPPPPYRTESKEEALPLYDEASHIQSLELESILSRFAPRWDDQRVQHYLNADSKQASTEQLLDRMEEYRHKDQEWSSQDQIRLMKITTNMYHSQSQKPNTPCPKKPSCVFAVKSKYQKITLSIAKEREHLVQQLKKVRSSPCLPNDELDFFLNTISITTSQSQMSNQRAMRMVATA